MKKYYITAGFLCFFIINSGISFSNTPFETDNKYSMDLAKASYKDSEYTTTDLFPITSRSIHNFNIKLLETLKPEFDYYKQNKNNTIHKGLSNFLKNLQEPLYFSNSLLQFNFTSSFKSLSRFLINSTVGLFGTIDIASKIGIEKNKTDFGETLGTWGMKPNGFFVMPIYAQTTTRDFTGTIVDSTLNPINFFISWQLALFLNISTKLFDLYDGYDLALLTHETAIDSYETFKTMYLQYKINKIQNLKLEFNNKTETNSKLETENVKNQYDFDME